jgi:hypothetical protein
LEHLPGISFERSNMLTVESILSVRIVPHPNKQ